MRISTIVFRFHFLVRAPFALSSSNPDWNEIRFTSFRHLNVKNFSFQFCLRWFMPLRLQKERKRKETRAHLLSESHRYDCCCEHKGASGGKKSCEEWFWIMRQWHPYVVGWKICFRGFAQQLMRGWQTQNEDIYVEEKAARVTKVENDDKRSKAFYNRSRMLFCANYISLSSHKLRLSRGSFCSCALLARRESHK